jgi:hypothetical protein
MGNQEYMLCPRSHVFVGFHSSYAFLENNLVYTMLNPLRKKRVKVYAMPKQRIRYGVYSKSIPHAYNGQLHTYDEFNKTGINQVKQDNMIITKAPILKY